MNTEITHVHFGSTPHTYEAITQYRWRVIETNETGTSDRATMVAWVNTRGNYAYVASGAHWVAVESVHPGYGQPYLRTLA
jgi:hypothetical protein